MSIPKSKSEPNIKPKPVFGRLVRSKHMKQRSRKQPHPLRRTMLFVVFHAWEPSGTAARQRIAACDQPGKRSGDLAKAIDIVVTGLKRRGARLQRCCGICSAGLLLPM
ncbi:hypothetical protein PsJ27TS7_50040 [Paenibacillus dendritiformis]